MKQLEKKHTNSDNLLNEQSFKSLFMRPSDENQKSPIVYNRYSSCMGIDGTGKKNVDEYNPMNQMISVKDLISDDPKAYNP